MSEGAHQASGWIAILAVVLVLTIGLFIAAFGVAAFLLSHLIPWQVAFWLMFVVAATMGAWAYRGY